MRDCLAGALAPRTPAVGVDVAASIMDDAPGRGDNRRSVSSRGHLKSTAITSTFSHGMPDVLLTALEAFLAEHRRCGELDAGVEDGGCGWYASAGHRWRSR